MRVFDYETAQVTVSYLEIVLGEQYDFVINKSKIQFSDGTKAKGHLIYIRNCDNNYMRVFSNSSEIAHWAHTILCSCEVLTPDIMDEPPPTP